MARFSLKNPFSRDINYSQFMEYAETFKRAVSKEFGMPCSAKFAGYKTSAGPVLFEGVSLAFVTEQMWREAGALQGIIGLPGQGRGAEMDFKDPARGIARFSVHPGGDDVFKTMKKAFPDAVMGDGHLRNNSLNRIVRYDIDRTAKRFPSPKAR